MGSCPELFGRLFIHMGGIVIFREQYDVYYPYIGNIGLAVFAWTADQKVAIAVRRIRKIGMQYVSSGGFDRNGNISGDEHREI